MKITKAVITLIITDHFEEEELRILADNDSDRLMKPKIDVKQLLEMIKGKCHPITLRRLQIYRTYRDGYKDVEHRK